LRLHPELFSVPLVAGPVVQSLGTYLGKLATVHKAPATSLLWI